MVPIRGRRAGLVLAALVAVLLAGAGCSAVDSVTGGGKASGSPSAASNGVADKAPADQLAAARTALAKAKSLRVKGNGTADGQVYALDMRIQGTKGGRGTITYHHNPVEILRVGDTAYLKGGAAVWTDLTGSRAAAELLKGKYLKAEASDPDLADLLAFTNVQKLSAQLLTAKGAVTKADRRQVRGVDTSGVTYSTQDGKNNLYVATAGPAYPMYLSTAGNTADVTSALDFLEYDEPFQVAEPPADQVVDIDKIR
jgi:hypothetical protein